MDILAGEGQLGYRFDDYVRAARRRVADLHPWGQQGEINELPPIYGEILNLLLIDYRTHHGTRGFRDFAHVLHRDFLCDLSHGQVEVQVARGTEIEVKFLGRFLEPGLLCGHRVVARGKQRDLVISGRAGCSGAGQPGSRVHRGHGRLRNGRPAGVVDPPLDRDGNHLSVRGRTHGGQDYETQCKAQRQ